MNETLGPRGLPSLTWLPEVYAANQSLPHGVSLWDPYAHARDRPLVLPHTPLPPLQRNAGDEVFIYFSREELSEPAIVDALRQLPFKASLVAPVMTAEVSHKLSSNARLTILPQPLSREEIVRRSRVILCAGQAGTLSLGVLAGIPVLALPMQHEQLSNAMRAAEHLNTVRVLPRLSRNAQAIVDALDEVWSSPALGSAAKLYAQELREGYEGDALGTYRRALGQLLMDLVV